MAIQKNNLKNNNTTIGRITVKSCEKSKCKEEVAFYNFELLDSSFQYKWCMNFRYSTLLAFHERMQFEFSEIMKQMENPFPPKRTVFRNLTDNIFDVPKSTRLEERRKRLQMYFDECLDITEMAESFLFNSFFASEKKQLILLEPRESATQEEIEVASAMKKTEELTNFYDESEKKFKSMGFEEKRSFYFKIIRKAQSDYYSFEANSRRLIMSQTLQHRRVGPLTDYLQSIQDEMQTIMMARSKIINDEYKNAREQSETSPRLVNPIQQYRARVRSVIDGFNCGSVDYSYARARDLLRELEACYCTNYFGYASQFKMMINTIRTDSRFTTMQTRGLMDSE